MRLSAALLCLAGCVSLPGPAAAQGTSTAPAPEGAGAPRASVVLSWVRGAGAEGCVAAGALRDDVRGRLGYDPFVHEREPTGSRHIEGIIAREDEAWTVELYRRGESGETAGTRTLRSDAEGCEALSEAAALAVALAIDPEAALAPPRPAPARQRAAEEPAAELPADEAEPAPTADARERPERVRLSLGATGAYDFNPGLGFGARLGVDGPIVDHLRWMGAVTHWAETRTALAGGDFGISQTLFSVGLCGGFGEPWIQLDGCVSADLGASTAVVYSPIPEAPGERFAFSATALARLDIQLFAPLWLAASAGVVVPVVRYQYRVRNRDVVFEPSYASPFFAVDIAVRFR